MGKVVARATGDVALAHLPDNTFWPGGATAGRMARAEAVRVHPIMVSQRQRRNAIMARQARPVRKKGTRGYFSFNHLL